VALRNFIGGKFADQTRADAIPIFCPANGQLIGEVPDSPAAAIGDAVGAGPCRREPNSSPAGGRTNGAAATLSSRPC
jgi:acyl-CoA reductase-like NAD-dependent aldehyde dehydrogenase